MKIWMKCLEVDGIDSLFIGAADLSRSIGARNDENGSECGCMKIYPPPCEKKRAGISWAPP